MKITYLLFVLFLLPTTNAGLCMETPILRNYPATTSETRGSIVFGHAMFNDSEYLLKPEGKSVVDFFRKSGYAVYVFSLDFYSENYQHKNFDTFFKEYLDVFSQLKGKENLNFIGHSLGASLGAAAAGLLEIDLKSSILLAPAFFGFTATEGNSLAKLQIGSLKKYLEVAKNKGFFPAIENRLGNQNSSIEYLEQLLFWTESKEIISMDMKTNYANLISKLGGKILLVEAQNDQEMAPEPNINWYSSILPEHQRLKINKENNLFDSNHFSIIYGRNARKMALPVYLDFLKD